MRVALNVGWLLENGLFSKAMEQLGWEQAGPPEELGIPTSEVFLKHDDELLFYLSQLPALGFEIGSHRVMEEAIRNEANRQCVEANELLSL